MAIEGGMRGELGRGKIVLWRQMMVQGAGAITKQRIYSLGTGMEESAVYVTRKTLSDTDDGGRNFVISGSVKK